MKDGRLCRRIFREEARPDLAVSADRSSWIPNATYNGSPDPSRTPREAADRLIEILSDPGTRHAQQAMLRQAIPFRPNGRPDFDRIAELEDNYRNVDIPCLIPWGARDENLSVNMGYKLVAQLPQAWLRIFPSCTHALPSERPVLVSQLVHQFVATGRLALGERTLRIDDVLPETRTVDALLSHWEEVVPQAAALQDNPRGRQSESR